MNPGPPPKKKSRKAIKVASKQDIAASIKAQLGESLDLDVMDMDLGGVEEMDTTAPTPKVKANIKRAANAAAGDTPMKKTVKAHGPVSKTPAPKVKVKKTAPQPTLPDMSDLGDSVETYEEGETEEPLSFGPPPGASPPQPEVGLDDLDSLFPSASDDLLDDSTGLGFDDVDPLDDSIDILDRDICPNCEAELKGSKKFCVVCGQKLDGDEEDDARLRRMGLVEEKDELTETMESMEKDMGRIGLQDLEDIDASSEIEETVSEPSLEGTSYFKKGDRIFVPKLKKGVIHSQYRTEDEKKAEQYQEDLEEFADVMSESSSKKVEEKPDAPLIKDVVKESKKKKKSKGEKLDSVEDELELFKSQIKDLLETDVEKKERKKAKKVVVGKVDPAEGEMPAAMDMPDDGSIDLFDEDPFGLTAGIEVDSLFTDKEAEDKISSRLTAREVEELNAQAERALAKGKEADAFELYRQAMEKDPNDHVSKWGAGQIMLNMGGFDEAKTLLDSALDIMFDGNHYQLLSLSLEQLKDLALEERDRFRTDNALELLKIYMQREKNDMQALTLYARILDKLGKSGEALEAYLQALKENHESPRIQERLASLGFNFLKERNVHDGRRVFRALERKIPHHGPAMLGNAYCELLLENPEEVLPLVRLVDLSKFFDSVKEHIIDMGFEASRQGEADLALDLFRIVIDLDPNNVDAITGVGDAHRGLREYARAMSCYNMALKHDPTNLKVLQSLTNLSRKFVVG